MGSVLGCCGALFGLFVVLLIGRALVCAAVAAANRVVGPVAPPDTFGQWDDWDSDDEPALAKSRRRGATGDAIPEPGLATGMLITFVFGLVNAGGAAVCAVLPEAFDIRGGDDDLVVTVALVVVGLPVAFFVHAFLLVLLLPTTFGRAALVAFLHYLIVFLVVLVAVAAVYLALGS